VWVKLCLVPSKTGVSNFYLSVGYYFVVIYVQFYCTSNKKIKKTKYVSS